MHMQVNNVTLDGYLTNDVLYKWRTRGKEKEIEMADDMRLSQFDLIDRRAGNDTSTHVSSKCVGAWVDNQWFKSDY